MTDYSFPSLGQTIRFAFDVLGVLPRKRSDSDGLDEKDKKRIQKKLQRLANEEGRLEDSIEATFGELSDILGNTLKNDEIRFAICETLFDIYEVYKATIKSDGTYLSARETIEWFCVNHAIPRLAFSVPKHLQRTNLTGKGLIFPPNRDWYLPSVVDGKITWPLSKTMLWIYQLLDISQERFHYSNRGKEANHDVQLQNLENTRKWTRGNNTPSWSVLKWTFFRAFDELAACEDDSKRRVLPEAFRDNVYYILFIARFSTDLCKRIEKSHGLTFLEKCFASYQQHQQWLVAEVETINLFIEELIEKSISSGISSELIRFEYSDRCWGLVADRLRECVLRVDEIIRHQGEIKDVEAEEEELILQFGEYPVRRCFSYLDEQKQKQIPDGFIEAFCRALELTSTKATESEIDEYEAELKHRGLEKRLMWVAPWLRAVIRYKDEDYGCAMKFAEIAFNHAKYRAGNKQYNLVNLYVELAAKNKDKKRFRKGIEWAQFIGLKIRWLRDDDPTDENIDFVYKILGKAQCFQF